MSSDYSPGLHMAKATHERDALLVENGKLRDKIKKLSEDNATLKKQVAVLKGPKSRFVTLSARNDLDVFPNEVLSEILRHLHQPYHFHNYSRLLIGSDIVSAASRPWNPVSLQLVCRRWRTLARSLFYRQVAVDAGAVYTVNALNDSPGYRKGYSREADLRQLTKLVIVFGRRGKKPRSERRANMRPTPMVLAQIGTESMFSADNILLASVFMQPTRSVVFYTGPDPSTIKSFLERVNNPILSFASAYARAALGSAVTHVVQQGITFRLPDVGLVKLIRVVQDNLPDIDRFELDVPFALPDEILDAIFPAITSIVRHLSNRGATRKIVFGMHSNADATDLRIRIDALGQLEVVVEVVVLEM